MAYRGKFKPPVWMGLLREMSMPKAEEQSKESILEHYTIFFFQVEKEYPEIMCNTQAKKRKCF